MGIYKFISKTFVYKLYATYCANKRKKQNHIRNAYFKKECVEVLNAFSKTLDCNKLNFWLEFGTLLGYYRDKDFIKHDFDLDFGAYLKDAFKIRKVLESNGFVLLHQFRTSDGGLEDCYKYKHTTIDIFYFREGKNALYCNSFTLNDFYINRFFKKELRCLVKKIEIPNKGFRSSEFKGVKVYIPNDVEQHLCLHYGASFMIPNANFNYRTEASNITYYDYKEMRGYVKIFHNY